MKLTCEHNYVCQFMVLFAMVWYDMKEMCEECIQRLNKIFLFIVVERYCVYNLLFFIFTDTF